MAATAHLRRDHAARSRHRRRRRWKRRDGSQPRRRRRRSQQRDWSDLPSPALFSILHRLTTFRDIFAFAGVCGAWRAVSSPALPDLIPSQPPLLCASGGHHFYSLAGGRFYRSTLPGLCRQDAAVRGFSHGYLIMGDGEELWLVNPLTGHELLSIPLVGCTHDVEWAALTAPPTSPGCVLMAWCHLTIAYWRPGDLLWSMYWCETEEERACARWPIALGGAIYARSLKGRLLRFEFDGGQLRVSRIGARPLMPGVVNVGLVVSGGEILAIHGTHGPIGEGDGCAVYRLDCSGGEWVRVEDLGERALLFTHWGPVLCDEHPAKWGGEGNCIYFLRPPWWEVKVFRMEGCRTEALPGDVGFPSSHSGRKCCCFGWCCSSFIWVLPKLCY